jgi:hypothetical protein
MSRFKVINLFLLYVRMVILILNLQTTKVENIFKQFLIIHIPNSGIFVQIYDTDVSF